MIADEAVAEAPAQMTGSGDVSIFELSNEAKRRFGFPEKERFWAVVFGKGANSAAQVFSHVQLRMFAQKLLQSCR